MRCCLISPETVSIQLSYSAVVLLCNSSVCQILIDISALKILRLIRAKKMKTSMLQVRIDSDTLLSDGFLT